MKRLLAIDGGGVRGVFALGVLEKMEQLLQQKQVQPQLRLADYFDYIGGTSTGAIIATFLAWGYSVKQVKQLYFTQAPSLFAKRHWLQRYKSKFQAEKITEILQSTFVEEDGSPALLGTSKLQTRLLVVTRNATTGSAWPLTNNPEALFNQRESRSNNLRIPLWQIVRASTAAPTFFPPQRVLIYDEAQQDSHPVECWFEDGGMTPYNNPAYLLYLKATLPEYRTQWPLGEENLHLVSVGAGFISLGRNKIGEANVLEAATSIPLHLIQAGQQYQDILCRATGRCLFGAKIDSELGKLDLPRTFAPHFSYVRYNQYLDSQLEKTERKQAKELFALDNLAAIPLLEELGNNYAEKFVKIEHL